MRRFSRLTRFLVQGDASAELEYAVLAAVLGLAWYAAVYGGPTNGTGVLSHLKSAYTSWVDQASAIADTPEPGAA